MLGGALFRPTRIRIAFDDASRIRGGEKKGKSCYIEAQNNAKETKYEGSMYFKHIA